MAKTFKPGEKIPVSAQYAKIGPRGGTNSKEITGVKGKIFPPAPKAGITYKLTDRTKHKR